MSSNNGRKAVTNPYAKKRKAPPPASTAPPPAAAAAAAATSSCTTTAASSSLGGSSVSFSTFSQAFESIEDSRHYQNQQQQRASTSRERRQQEQRAQQRAFEKEAAAASTDGANGAGAGATTNNATNTNNKNMKDRDYHAWMQPHCLYVSTRQRGNGVLQYIRNVPVQESRMVPDFVMSSTRCALFLSCKYHALYPRYIYKRLGELGTDFTLRVLLVLVDEQQDNANTLLQLNLLAVQHNMTMVLAWSEEEAARYLETYKAFDGKDASLIQKKEKTNFADSVVDVLTTCQAVNKTDAAQLLTQFQSVRAIAAASMEELGVVSGMGQVKVKRLYDALHKPFSTRAALQKKKQRLEKEQKQAAAAAAAASLAEHGDNNEQEMGVENAEGNANESDNVAAVDTTTKQASGQEHAGDGDDEIVRTDSV